MGEIYNALAAGQKIYFEKDVNAIDKKNKLNKFSLLVFTFLVFLLSSYVSAQVIIKEKVEINPQSEIVSDDPSQISTSTLLLEVFWSPSTAPVGISVISYPCDQPPLAEPVTGGYNSLLIENLTPGSFMWQVWSTENFTSGSYRISINDSVVAQSSFDFISTYLYTFTNIVYEVKIYNTFLMGIEKDLLCFDKDNKIFVGTGWQGCGTTSFNALAEPVELTIIEGAENVSFYQYWRLLGDTFSGYWQPLVVNL